MMETTPTDMWIGNSGNCMNKVMVICFFRRVRMDVERESFFERKEQGRTFFRNNGGC